MRTTVTLDDDVAAEIERLRREEGLSLSAAVNVLVRRGIAVRGERRHYRHRAVDLDLRIDVSDIGDALETLDD